ncbi:MAG: hypothetical protein Q3976_09965 [Corynebacterium sp.]|nr:hypothetical protein [Corynebacterium sp.]
MLNVAIAAKAIPTKLTINDAEAKANSRRFIPKIKTNTEAIAASTEKSPPTTEKKAKIAEATEKAQTMTEAILNDCTRNLAIADLISG